ncbi:MAG: hypothetical protein WBX25_22195 [Rhodomicrobium sp.]
MDNAKRTSTTNNHWHERDSETGKRRLRQDAVDEALEQTFPASDPPAYMGSTSIPGSCDQPKSQSKSKSKRHQDQSKK